MSVVRIAALLMLVEKTYGGYIYPRPPISLKLSETQPKFREETQQNTIHESPQQTIESVVSYYVPFQNYQDLHQSNVNLLRDDGYVSREVDDVATSSFANDLRNLGIDSVQHTDNEADNVPHHIDIVAPIEQHHNLEFNTIQDTDVSSANGLSSLQLQSNTELSIEQHAEHDANNFRRNPPSSLNTLNIVSPQIMKHVYFHVPPSEIEETTVRKVTPKIKNYKIIFIKVPSQKTESYPVTQLQTNTINQVAPIEEKTIIYLLSKKPTTQQVYVPKPAPFQHEVFFVKYNGDVDTAVTQISDNLEQILN